MHSQRIEHTKIVALTVSARAGHVKKSFLHSSQRAERALAFLLISSQRTGQASASFLAHSKCIERATMVIFNELKKQKNDLLSRRFIPNTIH